ncbi:MAG: sulfite exporter TauE/SafE family protein [Polyangiaceae bacterium]
MLFLIVALAFTIESALGFGATVVTIALGSFLVPINELLPSYVPVNMLLSLYMAVRYRRDVAWRMLFRKIVPLMALGLPIGLLAFSRLGADRLRPAFGAFVVVLSLIELWRARASAPPPSTPPRWVSPLMLLLGGIVHGAFSTGGPMAVYVAGQELHDKAVFRSTLSALWITLNIALLSSYAMVGALSTTTLNRGATLLPALAVGMLAGEWAHHRIPATLFRKLVFSMLLIAGVVLLLR